MLIIGHRGAMGYAPENTLASFRKALQLQVDMIEFDVYALHDGSVVVIHDPFVNRTTNGSGMVMKKSLKELRALDAGDGEKIPTLQEVLDVVGKKAKVNIELKGKHSAAPVATIIKHYVEKKQWNYEDFLVSSFSRSELKQIEQIAPEIPRSLLTIQGISPFIDIGFAKKIGAKAVSPWSKYINALFVSAAHRKGLNVYVYTVNTTEEALRMKKLGVDGIFTNYPDLVKSVL